MASWPQRPVDAKEVGTGQGRCFFVMRSMLVFLRCCYLLCRGSRKVRWVEMSQLFCWPWVRPAAEFVRASKGCTSVRV